MTIYEQIDMALTDNYGFATFLDTKGIVSMDNLSSLWDEYLQAKDYPTYFDDAIEEIIAFNKYRLYHTTTKYSQQLLDTWESFIIGDLLGKVVFESIPILAPTEKPIWNLFFSKGHMDEKDIDDLDNPKYVQAILANTSDNRFLCPIANQIIYQTIIRTIAADLQENDKKRHSLRSLDDVIFDTKELKLVNIVKTRDFFESYFEKSIQDYKEQEGHDFESLDAISHSDFYYLTKLIQMEKKGFIMIVEEKYLEPFFNSQFLDQLATYIRNYLIGVLNKIRALPEHKDYKDESIDYPVEYVRIIILQKLQANWSYSPEYWCYVYYILVHQNCYKKIKDFINDLKSLGIKAPSKTQFSRCEKYYNKDAYQEANWYDMSELFYDKVSRIRRQVAQIISLLRNCM